MQRPKLISIGASTGGVDALIAIIRHFPADMPPVLITQHTGAKYSSSLAEVLNRNTLMTVHEADDAEMIKPGQIYLAPGNTHHMVLSRRDPLRINLVEEPLVDWHRPSITSLFQSVSRLGAEAVGVLLTGMGRDGATGLLQMKEQGAYTIAQDEASSLVYGMPKVAAEIGAVRRQMALEDIGPFLSGLGAATREIKERYG